MNRSIFRHLRVSLVLTSLLFPVAAQAQSDADGGAQRLWTTTFDTNTATDAGRAKPNRIQLFRIVPGFLSDPVGLASDDPNDPPPTDNGPDWIGVAMGNDNPFFDFRRPGDPGGVGYYKLHSQVQVFDSGATSLAVAVQAVTPAGLDQDGIANGPTIVSPSLCLFHTLDDGTSIQSFIGKNMNVNPSSLSGPIHRNVQYGVAVQRPLLDTGTDNIGSFYVFVEALGRYRYDDTTATAGPAAIWEMVPGVHWRMADTVWLSGGVLMPIGVAPVLGNARLWQLTCSFQF